MPSKRRFSALYLIMSIFVLLISSLFMSSCASSVSISKSNLNMYVDDTYVLEAKSSDEDALVLWESSDNKVAIVRRGKVTAIGKGECFISAYDDNGARAKCHVKVNAMNINISHQSKQVDLGKLNTFVLHADSEDDGEITWSTSNASLATVSNKGLVTCHNVGNVIISAYRKGGKASCAVSIIDSLRPEDYYVMKEGKNAVVASDPGVWYYWQNDGSVVSNAIYQNSGFVSNITSLSGAGVYYRYQPNYDAGEKYVISFKIMLNISAQITGKKTISVNADEWTNYSYSGTVSNSEPFYFQIKNATIPTSGSIVVSVKDIVVSDAHSPDYYEIEKGQNATVVANPGKWYYWPNGSDSISKGYHEDGQVHISINKLDNSAGMYFRYQPGGDDGSLLNVGDSYSISLDITMNITGTFTGNSSATITTPNTFVNYSYSGVVSSSNPFQITLKGVSVPESGTIDVVMKNIVVTNTTSPTSGYTVIAGQNAVVVANPGKWYYWTNSGDAVSTAKYQDDVLTASITALNSSQGIYFRYQPGGNDESGVEVGDTYTISFKITMSIPGNIGGKSSATVTTAGEFVNYSYTGEAKSAEPFNFTIKGLTIPSSGSIDITVKEVSITKIIPVETGIQTGNIDSAIANPGVWFVSKGEGDVLGASTQTFNTFSVDITSLTSNEGVTLYYQPGKEASNGLLIGDDYKLTAKIRLNTIASIGGSEDISVTAVNVDTDVTHSDVINTTSVFTFNLKNIDIPSSGTLTLSLNSLKFSSLAQGNMATVRANPGKWHYNSAGSAAFNVIPRISHDLSSGTIGVNISAFNGDHFYFRYQPGGLDGTGLEKGDSFRLTFTIVINKDATVAYGTSGEASVNLVANTPIEQIYEGTVSDNIFYIKLDKSLSVPISATLSNISVEAI